jgi:hypothetical protein
LIYPLIYTGDIRLLNAIRDEFTSEGFTFIRPDSADADAAIDAGEYAAITYRGGDTATIEDYPTVDSRRIDLPVAPDGCINGWLAARLIRAHFELWGPQGIGEIEDEIAHFRATGNTRPAPSS